MNRQLLALAALFFISWRAVSADVTAGDQCSHNALHKLMTVAGSALTDGDRQRLELAYKQFRARKVVEDTGESVQDFIKQLQCACRARHQAEARLIVADQALSPMACIHKIAALSRRDDRWVMQMLKNLVPQGGGVVAIKII